jgi:hypothetical protein
MTSKPRVPGKSDPKRCDMPGVSDTDRSDEEYRVGPGRPPKEFQFKPGQSGNPKGAKRKQPSIALDLKALFERAFSKKVKLTQGEKEQILSKAEVGIEQFANQFAKGDRHARRDLMVLTDKLGIAPKAEDDLDLTKLSDEELQQWRTLILKAMGSVT